MRRRMHRANLAPQGHVSLHRDSQRAKNIERLFWFGAGQLQELVIGDKITNNSTNGLGLVAGKDFSNTVFDQNSGGADNSKLSFTPITLSSGYTFATWIVFKTISTHVLCGNAAGSQYPILTIGATQLYTRTTDGFLLFTVPALTANKMYRICISNNTLTNGAKLYINGKQAGATGTQSGSLTVSALMGYDNSSAFSVNGRMHSALLSSRSWSASEVYQDYAAQTRWDLIWQKRKTIFLAASNAISLINPTETNIQQTTATVGATSDTALGTLYAYVKAGTSPTTPSKADMISGTGATYHGTDATPIVGANTFPAAGLTAGNDYHTFIYQVNGADDSNILDSGVWATQVSGSLPYRPIMAGGLNAMYGGMAA